MVYKQKSVKVQSVVRPVETGGPGGGAAALPDFSTLDLLPSNNDSEKKKVSKSLLTTSNSSKTTSNITHFHFI